MYMGFRDSLNKFQDRTTLKCDGCNATILPNVRLTKEFKEIIDGSVLGNSHFIDQEITIRSLDGLWGVQSVDVLFAIAFGKPSTYLAFKESRREIDPWKVEPFGFVPYHLSDKFEFVKCRCDVTKIRKEFRITTSNRIAKPLIEIAVLIDRAVRDDKSEYFVSRF
jgi:hypothetical protein